MQFKQRRRINITKERTVQFLFVMVLFTIYFHLAVVLPMDQAPDEGMRYDLAKWIYAHMRLPIGNEEEIVSPIWGFSYAYSPYLPSMIAALLMRMVSLFNSSEHALLLAARMVSVLASCGSVYLCFQIGRYVFKKKSSTYLLAVLVGFWPQVMFLSAYHNNDALSLFSCFLMLYNLLAGRKERWPVFRCVGLGFAISVCLLTYYYAYGWVLASVFFCIASCVCDTTISSKPKFIIQRAILVASVVLVCAGWYFIRNIIIYDGDILGMAASRLFKASYALTHEVHWPNRPATQGISIISMLFDEKWIQLSVKSYIGMFGYMTISLSHISYVAYVIVLAVGLILALYHAACEREGDRLLRVTLLSTALIPLIISIYGSYNIDYQPQGRYIISSLPALLCVIVRGYDQPAMYCGICLEGKLQSAYLTNKSKPQERKQCFRIAELNISTLVTVAFIGMGIFTYQNIMLKELIPEDEIQTIIAEDYSYLDLRFTTAKSSDGLFFVVCNEGFDVDGQWLAANQKDGVWHRIVNLSDYGKSGTYTVHIYRAFEDGSMEFVREAKVDVPVATHMNLLLTERENNKMKLYPIESYENVYFAVWKAGASEPSIVNARFNEDEQCWEATYAFEQTMDYSVLAYTKKERPVFIGGDKND